MPTVRVLRSFRDAKTGEVHKRGDKISVTADRAREIQSVDASLIEAPAPAKKATAKKATAKVEQTAQDSDSSKTE